MQRYYTSEKLIEVTKHRGYYNARSVAQGLSQIMGVTAKTMEAKISSGHFSREEMIVIASYFEMTPKEFCDVFLNGVFNEDELGHFIAHVDSPFELLHPPKAEPKERKDNRGRKSREANLQDILSQIDSL